MFNDDAGFYHRSFIIFENRKLLERPE